MTKKNDEELKALSKLKNFWQYMAYTMKYQTKEIFAVIIIILVFVLVLQLSGFEFGKLFDIFGGK